MSNLIPSRWWDSWNNFTITVYRTKDTFDVPPSIDEAILKGYSIHSSITAIWRPTR